MLYEVDMYVLLENTVFLLKNVTENFYTLIFEY